MFGVPLIWVLKVGAAATGGTAGTVGGIEALAGTVGGIEPFVGTGT
jgi:hypothetical protein